MSRNVIQRLADYGEVIDDAIAVDLAERTNPTSSDGDKRLRSPRQTRVLVGAASIAATALLIVAAVAVFGRNGDARSITVVTPPVDTQSASVAEAAPSTMPDTTGVASSASSVTNTVDTSPATTASLPSLGDLSAATTGLTIEASALPAGWVASQAGEREGNLGSGSGGYISDTLAALYSSDRSRILDTLDVMVIDPAEAHPDEILAGATPAGFDVNGSVVYSVNSGLVWYDADRLVEVSSTAKGVDLTATAQGLKARSDGGFDTTVLPPGFEQVAVRPHEERNTGPGWNVGYYAPDSVETDYPNLIVNQDHPGRPAEVLLAMTHPRAYAVTESGRRMIVQPASNFMGSSNATITWDQPDGSQVEVSYKTHTYAPPEQVTAQALAFARAVHRSTTEEWGSTIAQVASTQQTLGAHPWIAAGLAARGLSANGDVIPASIGTPVAFVPAIDQSGVGQSCEFVRQVLITCTPDNTALPAGATGTAARVDANYIRVVGPSNAFSATYFFKSGYGIDPLQPLSAAQGSLEIGYLALPDADLDTLGWDCVELTDKDDHIIADVPISGLNTDGICDNKPAM